MDEVEGGEVKLWSLLLLLFLSVRLLDVEQHLVPLLVPLVDLVGHADLLQGRDVVLIFVFVLSK